MAQQIKAIRGMHDVLPEQAPLWRFLEDGVRDVLDGYGYAEMRMPIVEMTDLFKRSIGEVTDIVEKEMYSFEDRNGDSLTLRPEGTAGCVRACMENGLLHNQTQRVWYRGPMFRHERPQKGRYRQFHQIGVEAFGFKGPDIDLETIFITRRIWQRLGLTDLELQINSLGDAAERAAYRELLVAYLDGHRDRLDGDSLRRLDGNPLRILDSKNPEMQEIIEGAPNLFDQLGEETRRHFNELRAGLDAAGIPYRINPRLVRGLDYYNRTVYEWVTTRLGAQGTVCAGGRFDGLVEQLGGRPTPAVGFALGVERLIALLEEGGCNGSDLAPHAYLVLLGEGAERQGVIIAERLRELAPRLRLQVHCGGGGFKGQFKKADKSGAGHALVVGDDELKRGVLAIKPLREAAEQRELTVAEAAVLFNELIEKKG
ncbi:MAG: histidine--tRNA ligase [Gammaproteobacteria bacterium]|nr:histidine--tRNA ligase [Gammaproteobacteria bacterium]MBU1655666.1 histidine--tRNA ligase [Gammaproteobacteria bacterium]MBU1960319.1 histidine--tRNA ligase [Gammaproteobacteria bacterium]